MQFDISLIKNYWHLVCHRNELPKSGDFIVFNTAAGDIVVFNDNDNLVAFDNRCPHRGAVVYRDTHGNQAASCQYHGWTYSRGKLIVPQRQGFQDCDIESAKWHEYRTDWCGDFLFVGIEPRQALYEQLDNCAELLENISFNIAQRLDTNQYTYECYWPLAVENALEPYHILMVHPQTLAGLNLEEGRNEFHGVNSVWYAPVGNTALRKQLGMLKRHFTMDFAYEGYMSIYLFPFTMLSSTFGYSYSLQHFLPVADGRTTFFSSRLLSAPVASEKSAKILESFFASTAKMNRQVFDEDHSVCKFMPRDSWNTEPLRYASSNEIKINHFRQSCREHLAHSTAL